MSYEFLDTIPTYKPKNGSAGETVINHIPHMLWLYWNWKVVSMTTLWSASDEGLLESVLYN